MAGAENAWTAAGGCGFAAVGAGGSAFGGTAEGLGVASGTAADWSAGGAGGVGVTTEFGASGSGVADGDSSCALDPTPVTFAGCLSNKKPEPKNAPVIPTATSATSTR